MNAEEMAVRLVEVDARAKSNTHRLDELEDRLDALNKLATAMEVMAKKMEYQAETIKRIEDDVNSVGTKVDAIEKKPGKRWDGMVEKLFYGALGVLAAALGAGLIHLLTAAA